MTTHLIEPTRTSLHGSFNRDLPPVLTIDPGDTVVYRTLDASWGRAGKRLLDLDAPEIARDPERDAGHANCGPVAVRGAQPGDTLAVTIEQVIPDAWGWTWAGPGYQTGDGLGLTEEVQVAWALDKQRGVARTLSDFGVTVPLHPFMGVMGNAPAELGYHSDFAPRSAGGNLDCRELVAGSTLYLPIAVEGALFSVGDGHAAQGDGEVSRMAIECPMERVALRFALRSDLHLRMPEASTPSGYLTIGLGKSLDEAKKVALNGMLDHLQREYGLARSHAMTLASCVAHLRVTQIVNGTVGIHALLPRNAFEMVPLPSE